MTRKVEVYTGAYASGKSEISINRALMLHEEGKQITLVDLDTVEPAYTLRPIKDDLEKFGIKVIAQTGYIGLGEAGNVITGEQQNCLLFPNDIVIDVGYGASGLDILEIITGIEKEENLNIYIVLNASKPETSNVDDIVEYVKWSQGTGNYNWKKFSGIISNTHFAEQTTKDDVITGFRKIQKAAEILNLPIIAITVAENIFAEFGSDKFEGIPLWSLKRFMLKALW
ncbi:MAG: hypothetical protein PHC34_02360 [Candidatus Gastranaerophilales bacterium]|nr:hypothetical protein [Candidatus Gastranaerophilales bacterium]